VPYANFKQDTEHFYPSENSMGHIVQFLDKLGTAIITVDYGSNAAGTGGGEPAEAAAWVAYANGNPNDAKVIGKDSTGKDWKTVGYWATLRSQAPLATDDGMNLLRASHPRPLAIKLWEIGSEVYKNSYYYGDYYGIITTRKRIFTLHIPKLEGQRQAQKESESLARILWSAGGGILQGHEGG